MMVKTFFLLLFSIIISAQKIQLVQLTQNIKDKSKSAKSLTIIDNREDKKIGSVSHQDQPFEIQFKDNQMEKAVQEWFLSDNKKLGDTDFVLLIETLKAYDEPTEKSILGKLDVKLSSFIKKNDKYYFVNRLSDNFSFQPKYDVHIPKLTANRLSFVLSKIINETYSNPVIDVALNETELKNYEGIISKQIKSLNSETLSDGVYPDFISFLNQEPSKEYSVNKNKKGIAIGFINAKNWPVIEKFFGYVENGTAFRLTPVGFLEMGKDEKGFYVISSKKALSPQGVSEGMIAGSLIGGVVGGAVAGAIDSKEYKSSKVQKVYIDSLTGAYIFD
jgi:hypothetical protein